MNKENTGISKTYYLLIIVWAVLILPVDSFALDIHNITINETEYRVNLVPDGNPYEFSCGVRGNDITAVMMTVPNGDIYYLVPWHTPQYDWGFSIDNLTQAELLAKFPSGDYIFTFNGWVDHVTLYYNPTVPGGFANITYPAHNSYNIPLNPTITWDSCVGYGDALSMALFEEIGGMVDTQWWIPIGTTTWAVGPLTPGLLHSLEVSVYTGTTPSVQSTASGDVFDFYSCYENCNEIFFTTIPSIGTLTGWIFLPPGVPDIGYSLEEDDLLYFYSSEPVWNYNFTTGLWGEGPKGWLYVDWPFYYALDTGDLWFAWPPVDGLWVYHFSTGQWFVLPQIIP